MKSTVLIITVLLVAIGFVNADASTKKKTIDPFDKISLRISANIYLEQGDERSIEVTADEETLDKLIIEVINKRLIIRFPIEDVLFRNFNPGPIDIHVVTNQIKELYVQGSGNIIAENLVVSESLDLSIAGSGDIKLSELECERLDANITGSGDIVVSGKKTMKFFDITIAGSGDVMAYQLPVEDAEIRIAGSGDCDVYVTEFLDAKILGSGDITYKGTPEVDSSVSGSGKIKKHN